MKRTAQAIILLAVIAGAGWVFRVPILLTGISIMAEQSTNTQPNQEVVWSTGADPRRRSIDNRPPNIVLILADDLGFNDVSLNGGGVGGGTVPTPHINLACPYVVVRVEC